jgi:polyisoprenoid-binding protein YceI
MGTGDTKTLLEEYKLDTGSSNFIIKGTSSLHDWEMTSNSVNGAIAFFDTNQKSIQVKDINVVVGVRTFESGNRVMNKKCYAALKDESNPNINYRFKSIEEIKNTGSGSYNATLKGNLTIAGKTRAVNIDVQLVVYTDKVGIAGNKALKMSDFDVEPPTALLGTLKTGNDIIIEFNLNYLSK